MEKSLTELQEFLKPILTSKDFCKMQLILTKVIAEATQEGFKNGISYAFTLQSNSTYNNSYTVSTPPKVKSKEEQAAEILNLLGMPPNILGYNFIIEALVIVSEQPELIHYITKELYPTIAKKYKTKSSRVERAIRHAIHILWLKNSKTESDVYFNKLFDHAKPTNSQLIATLSNLLKYNSLN